MCLNPSIAFYAIIARVSVNSYAFSCLFRCAGLCTPPLLNCNLPIVKIQHPLTSLRRTQISENQKMFVISFLYYLCLFRFCLSLHWRIMFLQKETVSPSSAIDSVSMDESHSGTNAESVDNGAASPKAGKINKAGEKAPPEAIKSWKENGFSR